MTERFERLLGRQAACPTGGHVVVVGLGNVGYADARGSSRRAGMCAWRPSTLDPAAAACVAGETGRAWPVVDGRRPPRSPSSRRRAWPNGASAVVAVTGDDAVEPRASPSSRES